MFMLESLENVFNVGVQFGVLFLEFIGVFILIGSAVRSVIGLIRKDDRVRLSLAEGIALALEFKLGGEVLRTAIVRQASELIILGAIVLLRAALTFLIHWEIKQEQSKIKPVQESEVKVTEEK